MTKYSAQFHFSAGSLACEGGGNLMRIRLVYALLSGDPLLIIFRAQVALLLILFRSSVLFDY